LSENAGVGGEKKENWGHVKKKLKKQKKSRAHGIITKKKRFYNETRTVKTRG